MKKEIELLRKEIELLRKEVELLRLQQPVFIQPVVYPQYPIQHYTDYYRITCGGNINSGQQVDYKTI